jgi:prepilin-type N-terminal cleavage/methylation domain-containing protein/prepilin-type processing-associated H-X9-DG protein
LKKAFTLIELLVVIAIIAILAAILFPVFAQAKAAAKRSASLSNVKQIATASQMYGADYDDNIPLLMNGQYTYMTNPTATQRTDSWVWELQPYIKNLTLMVDPTGSDASNIFGSGPFAWFRNQNLFPYYGFNFLFLSPWNNCNVAESRSFTQASDVAATVMFTQSRHPTYTQTIGYYTAAAPGMYPVILPHPIYCIYTGTGWAKKPAATPTVPYTAEINIKSGEGSNVAWLDGHAKFLKDTALAAGTNYAASTNPLTTSITDKTVYLWNLDDDYFGG